MGLKCVDCGYRPTSGTDAVLHRNLYCNGPQASLEGIDPKPTSEVRVRGVLVPPQTHVGHLPPSDRFTGSENFAGQVERHVICGGLRACDPDLVVERPARHLDAPRDRAPILSLNPHIYWSGDHWRCYDKLGKSGVSYLRGPQGAAQAYRRWEAVVRGSA